MATSNGGGPSPRSSAADSQFNMILDTNFQSMNGQQVRVTLLEAIEELLDDERIELANRLDEMGEREFAMGRLVDAKALWWLVLVIRQRALGAAHKDVALTLSALGELHESAGEFGEAASFYRRALEIMQSNLQPGHPNLAIALQRLADVCVLRGDYDEADRLFEQTLTFWQDVLGSDHPAIAGRLDRYSALLMNMQQSDRAAAFHERAAEIRMNNCKKRRS